MENKETKIGVAQKAIIFREDGKILTMRRTETAPTRPLGWDLPGGELEIGEDAKAGILREIKEETGLDVNDLEVFDAFSGFNDVKEFWMTICYTGSPASGKVVLSYEHDDSKWVTPDEFLKLHGISPRHIGFIEKFKNAKGL